MSSPNNDPDLDLDLSFYGPGSLACWYLALLCVIITWTFHPTKNFFRFSLSPDFLFFTLYACLAAYHMARQITNFTPDEILTLSKVIKSSLNPERPDRDMIHDFSPTLQKKILCLQAAIGVCSTCFWLELYALIGMSSVMLLGRDRLLRLSQRLLPWVLILSELWVFCCFCFLASRCGLGNVISAVFIYSFNCSTTVLLVYPTYGILWYFSVCCFANGIVVLSDSFVHLHSRTSTRPAPREEMFFQSSTRGGFLKTFLHLLGYGMAGILISTALLIIIVWVLPISLLWGLLVENWFPDLGVRISAIDQILSLGTGIMAVFYTSHYTFEGEDGERSLTKMKQLVAGLFYSQNPDSFRGRVGRLINKITGLLWRVRRARDAEGDDDQYLLPSMVDEQNGD